MSVARGLAASRFITMRHIRRISICRLRAGILSARFFQAGISARSDYRTERRVTSLQPPLTEFPPLPLGQGRDEGDRKTESHLNPLTMGEDVKRSTQIAFRRKSPHFECRRDFLMPAILLELFFVIEP